MAAEPAPRLGLPLLVWLVLVGIVAFACAPVLLALLLVFGAGR